jgi:serine/threonine protein kinase
MGCHNSKQVNKTYSLSFDDDPLNTTSSSLVHHDTDHLVPHSPSKKLEVIIDSNFTNQSPRHGHPYPLNPSSSASFLFSSKMMTSSCAQDDQQQQEEILLSGTDYEILSLIQEGAIGKVYHARHLQTHQDYAMKFFGYTSVDPEERDIEHEIRVLYSFRGIHGIIQLAGYFYDTSDGLISGKVYCHPYPVIVMELLTGGELFHYIHQQNQITEQLLSRIFYQIIVSVQSIHAKRYIHRDIKLENMMFSADTPSTHAARAHGGTSVTDTTNGVIKIIDFGLMVKVTGSDGIYHEDDLVGTPGYLAPECLDYYDYSYASDIWSLGCCLYSMLSGLLPFNPPSDQAYVHHRYRPMTGPAWINISSQAKDLIKMLLQRNAHSRPSLEQILLHPWLIDAAPTRDLGNEYLSRMKYLSLKQKLKSFFLNSTKLVATNMQTRDQLNKILPLLRKESSIMSRSSSNDGSLATIAQSHSSPHSRRPNGYYLYLQSSTSTLGAPSPQRKKYLSATSTPPPPSALRSTHAAHKSTPPAPAGGGGENSPYINDQFSILSKPPVRPPTSSSSTPAAVAALLTSPPTSTPRLPSPAVVLTHSSPSSPASPPHALRSSHSLDFLGRQTQQTNPDTGSPIKPIRYMSENELQTRLQSFKRSVLSSLLKSTSARGASFNLTRGGGGSSGPLTALGGGTEEEAGEVAGGVAQQYTINKETFLCLMIDAGLPELASSRVFHIFDTDNNGVLDIKEFLLTMLAFQSHSTKGGHRSSGRNSRNSAKGSIGQPGGGPDPRRSSGKFYRTKEQQLEQRQQKKGQLRRSTLDHIDEMKGEASEASDSTLLPPPLPPSSSLASSSLLPPLPPSSVPLSKIDLSPRDTDYDSYADSLTNSSPEKRYNYEGNDDLSGSGGIDESTEREEEHLARLYFDIFDLDGNGSIDKEELFVAVNAFFLDEISEVNPLIGTTPTAAATPREGKDSWGEGRGEAEGGEGGVETTNGLLAVNTKRQSRYSFDENTITTTAHGALPLNPSSAVSLLSPTASPPSAYQDIEELFQSIDSDHTGKITFEQFKIFFKKIRRSSSDIDETAGDELADGAGGERR